MTDAREFRKALMYSGKNSIDSFLEHRTDFIDIGKFSIACVLIRYEDLDKMFQIGNWYEYIFNKMSTDFEQFDTNQVTFISFNYDLSLETYFHTALKHSYGKGSEACAEKIKGIPIIHLHGQLGSLSWQKNGGRVYQKDNGREYAKKAAEGIKIIHEKININEDAEFMRAYSALLGAQIIYFLGFGYNKINVKRLNIPPHKPILGTAYGLETGERTDIEKLFDTKINRFRLALSTEDVLLFLRREVNWN